MDVSGAVECRHDGEPSDGFGELVPGSTVACVSATQSGLATQAGGDPASAGGPASVASMALSVTRHAPFTEPEDWHNVACGVDTLDIGLDVLWGPIWSFLSGQLDYFKEQAAGTDGIPSADGQFLIWPSGKAPNYRWHLQWPGFHLFIGKSGAPQGKTPNVYASIDSRTLWSLGVAEAVSLVESEINALGGTVLSSKPSRCDLATDFHLPEGLTLDFLLAHRVPRHVQHSHIMSGDRLETFYQGATKSPIRLRIYDKSLEVSTGGTKNWFYTLWGVEQNARVWRVEFQVRRQVLKQFQIHSVEELQHQLGGLWTYLTQEWMSLRIDDDANVSRRTVHPWWQSVQQCADQFGAESPCGRNFSGELASTDWYVSHTAGCLVSYAARKRLPNFESAAELMVGEMRGYWRTRDFATQYTLKSIRLGYPGLDNSSRRADQTEGSEVRP